MKYRNKMTLAVANFDPEQWETVVNMGKASNWERLPDSEQGPTVLAAEKQVRGGRKSNAVELLATVHAEGHEPGFIAPTEDEKQAE